MMDDAQAAATTKKCPACAEEIQATALKCRQCGTVLATLEWQAAVLGWRALPEPMRSQYWNSLPLEQREVFTAVNAILPAAPAPLTVSATAPRPPRSAKRGRSAPVWLAVLGALAVLAVLGAMLSPNEGRVGVTPSGTRYLKAPNHAVAPTTDLKALLDVHALLRAKATDLKATLQRQLGAGASVRFTESHGAKQWVATVGPVDVEVLPFEGKVAGVDVAFHPAARDRAAALALLGLRPPDTPPTVNAVARLTWTRAFPGIDEVRAFYEREGAAPIRQVSITPDKALEQRWYDQN